MFGYQADKAPIFYAQIQRGWGGDRVSRQLELINTDEVPAPG